MPYSTLEHNDTPPFPFVMLHGMAPGGIYTRITSASSHSALVAALLDDPAYEFHDGPETMKQRMRLAYACAAQAALIGLPLIISDVPGLNVIDFRTDTSLVTSLIQARLIELREDTSLK